MTKFTGNDDLYYYDDDDEYYEEYYDDYYDEYSEEYDYPARAFEKIDKPIVNPEFNESSILENILEIILDKKPKDKRKSVKTNPRYGNRQRQRTRYPLSRNRPARRPQEKAATNPPAAEDKTGNILASAGFFTVVLPVILAILLYLGVPVAQSLFAGASLITTFLLSGNNKSLITPQSIDSVVRGVLINILELLHSLSQGRVSNSLMKIYIFQTSFLGRSDIGHFPPLCELHLPQAKTGRKWLQRRLSCFSSASWCRDLTQHYFV